MKKESKLKKILFETISGGVGAAVGGSLAYWVYAPQTLDLSHEKYTFIGALVGALIGSYLYYTKGYKKEENNKNYPK
jgi:uncharacterized membrane protein YeaQ/YmgE (transglycosylase-associated protein family)